MINRWHAAAVIVASLAATLSADVPASSGVVNAAAGHEANRATVKLLRPAAGTIQQGGPIRGPLGRGSISLTASMQQSPYRFRVTAILRYRRGHLKLRGGVTAQIRPSTHGYTVQGRLIILSGDGAFSGAHGSMRVRGHGRADYSRAVYRLTGRVEH
jgi:hypothetical protein